MLFVVYGLDDPERGKGIRRRTRAAHLEFVARHQRRFRYGGALLNDAGDMIGTLALIEATDRRELEEFLSGDPYNREKLFKTTIVTATRQMLPEQAPGFLIDEIVSARKAG